MILEQNIKIEKVQILITILYLKILQILKMKKMFGILDINIMKVVLSFIQMNGNNQVVPLIVILINML